MLEKIKNRVLTLYSCIEKSTQFSFFSELFFFLKYAKTFKKYKNVPKKRGSVRDRTCELHQRLKFFGSTTPVEGSNLARGKFCIFD